MKTNSLFLTAALLLTAHSTAFAAAPEASYKPALKPLSKIMVIGALTTAMKPFMSNEEGEYLVSKMRKAKISPYQSIHFKPAGKETLKIAGMKGVLKIKDNGHAIEYRGQTFEHHPDVSFDKMVEKFEKQMRTQKISSLFIPAAEASFFSNCGEGQECVPNSSLAIALSLNAIAKYRDAPGSDEDEKFRNTLDTVADMSVNNQSLMAAGTEAQISHISCERETPENGGLPYIMVKYRNGAQSRIFCNPNDVNGKKTNSVTIWSKQQANDMAESGTMHDATAGQIKELFMNFCGINTDTGEIEKSVIRAERDKMIDGVKRVQMASPIQAVIKDRTGIGQ